MNNSIIYEKLKQNSYFCYLTKITNKHLSEYVDKIDNIIEPLTNFSGDTGYLYIDNKGMSLLVDGRFIIQAKKETKNIDVVLINNNIELISFLKIKYENQIAIIKNNNSAEEKSNDIILYIDDRYFSYEFTKMLKSIDKNFFKIEYDNSIAENIINENKKRYIEYYNNKCSRKLFLLEQENNIKLQDDIKKIIEVVVDKSNNHKAYITSNLEEIANISNLRLEPYEINDSLLFESFLILIDDKLYVYTDYDLKKDNEVNGIIIKKYDDFYEDIKNLHKVFNVNNIDILIDTNKNNSQIIELIINNDINVSINGFVVDDIYKEYKSFDNDKLNIIKSVMTIKTNKEIFLFEKINIIDAIAMIKFIYSVKHFDFDNNNLTEYSLKKLLDIMRSTQKKFLSTSFDTIVAYKDNSAICHYVPKESDSKRIKNDSILLVDSGANYIGGTTDITRTISLYKNKSKIPYEVKHYYTLVLKSMLALSCQKFPKGYKGEQLDIIARQYLFNECLDYNHGTGHGIGNATNVHYGTNIFSSRVKNINENVLVENQIQSCEPGIYFENKFGIRIENNTYTKKISGTEFLTFETLTLCPFDFDLINIDELNRVDIERLNNYNYKVFTKMKKYFKNDILDWLRDSCALIL